MEIIHEGTVINPDNAATCGFGGHCATYCPSFCPRLELPPSTPIWGCPWYY